MHITYIQSNPKQFAIIYYYFVIGKNTSRSFLFFFAFNLLNKKYGRALTSFLLPIYPETGLGNKATGKSALRHKWLYFRTKQFHQTDTPYSRKNPYFEHHHLSPDLAPFEHRVASSFWLPKIELKAAKKSTCKRDRDDFAMPGNLVCTARENLPAILKRRTGGWMDGWGGRVSVNLDAPQ